MNAPPLAPAATPVARPASAPHDLPIPKFSTADGFYRELKSRVERYFSSTNQRPRDNWRMYLKTVLILAWTFSAYGLLVFAVTAWWQALLLMVALGLGMAAIGFNIQHDGGHQGYSEHRWVNKLAALTIDLIGGSSYYWNTKHNVIHHTFANITDHDDDINLAPFGRLSPHQKYYSIYRWQHIYLWPLYGFLAAKWHLVEDFVSYATGTKCGRRCPRPRGWELFYFVAGKALFFSLAFVIPMLYHPVWLVLLTYFGVSIVLGLTMSLVFQLAHCVEEAEFPLPEPVTHKMSTDFAVHQIQTTVDFARGSKFWTWCLGGLNFQIEHHLFPRICHIHYPAISKIVEQTCREFGIRYFAHETFMKGLASHFRWLRRMGRPVTM